eukprot:TRINITY_DN3913_c0_g2_i1.p1 TRINITY_DN3913_c0_g2~~TRINITY_DN3913_c0_g2_i1.p1  ORF type:complete len:233 (+),score=19.11 TRINITY_DN3913_c0_g2_i1:99-797(+)
MCIRDRSTQSTGTCLGGRMGTIAEAACPMIPLLPMQMGLTECIQSTPPTASGAMVTNIKLAPAPRQWHPLAVQQSLVSSQYDQELNEFHSLRATDPEQHTQMLACRREREREIRARERGTDALARQKRLERRRMREKEQRALETPEERAARLSKRRDRDRRRNHPGGPGESPQDGQEVQEQAPVSTVLGQLDLAAEKKEPVEEEPEPKAQAIGSLFEHLVSASVAAREVPVQ